MLIRYFLHAVGGKESEREREKRREREREVFFLIV
jgi:hypothetical protein